MAVKVLITDGKNMDFTMLIKQLDADLSKRYGELQKQYEKHNKVEFLDSVVILYKDDKPVACGAFKQYDAITIELKRIFVTTENRRQGLSKQIIAELEQLGASKGYEFAVLETGIKQHEAINLYKNSGYEIIPNFEPYLGNPNSVCMKKRL